MRTFRKQHGNEKIFQLTLGEKSPQADSRKTQTSKKITEEKHQFLNLASDKVASKWLNVLTLGKKSLIEQVRVSRRITFDIRN